ncbi:hypothetical protein Vadar_024256 [Vaccinium darrowii]|uniref:Uncharacterized protein n=1 Tax=Vaccinium darrowii TaxID=229202 RepID=A0ACB7YY87_9ERIC|nr:hypothetical protein Vadar_024256 [Vaccinium darrowii]
MMDDLVKTAELYYDISSSEVKKAAREFFEALDDNKDGKVSVQEFLSFMGQQGHTKMCNPHFFNQIDRRGNGLLGFKEVMAVYYIIKSGRPFCCACDEFIPGMYFTCSKCFGNGSNLVCVCPKCFKDGAYKPFHKHNTFMDNYALLEAKRLQGNQHQPSSSVALIELPDSTANAVVPYNNKPKSEWSHRAELWLKALHLAINAASLAANCTIM